MNKSLIKIQSEIYDQMHGSLTRKQIRYCINQCFNLMSQELINGNNVMISNFGTLKQTNNNSISFFPSPTLKQSIKKIQKKVDNES